MQRHFTLRVSNFPAPPDSPQNAPALQDFAPSPEKRLEWLLIQKTCRTGQASSLSRTMGFQPIDSIEAIDSSTSQRPAQVSDLAAITDPRSA